MEDINVNCNPSFEVDIKLNGATNVLEQGLKGLDGQGFVMQGEWSEDILYKPYDVVTSINGVFCCLLLNDNSEPTDENPNWHKMLDTFQSEYESKEEERILTFNTSQADREASYTSAENNRDELYDKKENDITYEESREYRFVDSQNKRQSDYIAKEQEREVSYASSEQERENKYLIAETTGENSRENRFLDAENVRKEAEDIRLSNEIRRGENESIRLSKESERVSSEGEREIKETARVNAENLRLSKELIRIDNEDLRIIKEGERQSHEETRRTNETNRIQEEDIRKSNESARIIGENSRDNRYFTAESVRDDNYIKAETTNTNSRENRYIAAEALRNASVANKLTEINATINNEVSRVDSKILEVNSVAQRAEDAAIEAENITNLKVDKTSITQYFGGDPAKIMSQKAVTKNISQILQLEGEELWAYGVKWTQGQSSPTLERIGNMNMHKTLPCHKTRGCLVKDDATINYYLHDSTDFLKEDGVTPSVLDGSDGDVMNQRKFYYRTAIKDGVHVNWMSPYPLPGYTLYENLTGRYKASINRTTGKIHSVINNSPQFRGGSNTSAWDSDGRSLLGCAVSSISRVTFRSGARIDRAVEWNGSPEHDDFFVRLIYARVKWATHNFQLPFNSALDANGYHQGGFGNGTTNLSSAKWGGYNGYNPFIPCGYTAEFGNGSGVKDFVMPFEYDGYNTTLSQQKYVGVYDSGRVYASGEYVSESLDAYKGSGDALLYICILDAPAGTSLTNTTYFSLVNRTVTQAIRMDGEEQWFGEIWEHYANVIIEHNAAVEPKTSKAYIFLKPSEITETRTGNEEFLCDLPISDGYIREFNAGSIFPISTGGGSTTYGCDYYYCNYPASGIATRGCLGGGGANYGSVAGPACSDSGSSPSYSGAKFGGRLVRKSKNRVIIDKE